MARQTGQPSEPTRITCIDPQAALMLFGRGGQKRVMSTEYLDVRRGRITITYRWHAITDVLAAEG